MPYYIHKHEVSQEYGGPEEGGWYYDHGTPVEKEDWYPKAWKYDSRLQAIAQTQELNAFERIRQQTEEDYSFTSVLSHLSTHYSYSVHESPIPESYPKEIPHYE